MHLDGLYVRTDEGDGLESLLDFLMELEDEDRELCDYLKVDSLPTFGGPEPEDTMGIWSWDPDRLLVGEGGFDEWEIVSRE